MPANYRVFECKHTRKQATQSHNIVLFVCRITEPQPVNIDLQALTDVYRSESCTVLFMFHFRDESETESTPK
jgi:hypothetical protein